MVDQLQEGKIHSKDIFFLPQEEKNNMLMLGGPSSPYDDKSASKESPVLAKLRLKI